MIYAGDADTIDTLENKAEVLANGYNDGSTDYTQIGTSAYNSSYNDNAYVGYMYGTTGASTYEETHANVNSSTIKTKVDTWYEENNKGTEYEQYISDTLFCNDRSLDSGTGIGTTISYYGPYRRWLRGGYILTCPNKNDRFTVTDESKGNGNLTYPVGLLAFDEAVLAGRYSTSNSGYYLYTGNWYWTMSPYSFNGSNARVRSVSSTGYVYDDGYVGSSRGVRPVLSLKSGSLTGGQGTASDPYTV